MSGSGWEMSCEQMLVDFYDFLRGFDAGFALELEVAPDARRPYVDGVVAGKIEHYRRAS